MSSTPTSSLQLEKPAAKDYSYAWAPVINQLHDAVDDAIGGITTITQTSGTYILSDTPYVVNESRRAVLDVTSALTGNLTIQIPNRSKPYMIRNRTSGAFTVTVSTATPVTTVAVAQGYNQLVYCDGGNNVDPAGGGILRTSGAIAVGSGGTGLTAGTSGGILVFTGPTTLASSLAGTAGQLLAAQSSPIPIWVSPPDTAYQINATVAANALTIAIKTAAGADATSNTPIQITFRDSTIANGGPIIRTVTGALSVVVPSGQAMGTINTVPFRFWLVALDNAGTVELALVNCLVGVVGPLTQVFGLAEHTLISTTAIATAPSAGVYYSTTARASKAFRILGYVEYATGLATAGTYASAPTIVQLFGTRINKPGSVVRTVYSASTSGSSTTSLTFVDVTSATATITPSSAANPVKASYSAAVIIAAGGVGQNSSYAGQFLRSATTLQSTNVGVISGGGTNQQTNGHISAVSLDAPATASAVTYKLQQQTSIAAAAASTNNITIVLEEIMA